MKINFVNQFNRYADPGISEYGFGADPNYGINDGYDWTYTDPGYTEPLQKAPAVMPTDSSGGFLGSVHSLVQDAATILLATKGVPQQQQSIAGTSQNVAAASTTPIVYRTAYTDPAKTTGSKATTYIIIGVIVLLVIGLIVFLMGRKK